MEAHTGILPLEMSFPKAGCAPGTGKDSVTLHKTMVTVPIVLWWSQDPQGPTAAGLPSWHTPGRCLRSWICVGMSQWGHVGRGQEHPQFYTGSPRRDLHRSTAKYSLGRSSEISPMDLSGMTNSKIITYGENTAQIFGDSKLVCKQEPQL